MIGPLLGLCLCKDYAEKVCADTSFFLFSFLSLFFFFTCVEFFGLNPFVCSYLES